MRIKDLREDSDLTQEEVARYLHVRQNTYSQYENGQRQLPLACLIALAKLYRTSTDYILGLTDKKNRTLDFLFLHRSVPKGAVAQISATPL